MNERSSELVERLLAKTPDVSRVQTWARALRERSVPAGARVGLHLPLDALLDAAVASLACGAVVVPLSLRLEARPLAYHLNDAGAVAIATCADRRARVEAARALAPVCAEVIELEAIAIEASGGRRLVPEPRADGDPAFLSHAPEIPGGLPIGLVHDHGATLAAAQALLEALSLEANDTVHVELPLWEGALLVALAVRLAGATLAHDEHAPSTTVLVCRARDASATAARHLARGAPLRAVIGVGALAFGAMRDLVHRAPWIDVASALVVRELPLWLSLELLARSDRAPRLVPGPLRGLTLDLEGDAITVAGDALPRPPTTPEAAARVALHGGRLISHDRGARDPRGTISAAMASPERTALDVLDAHLPLLVSASPWREHVARRDLPYPIGCGRGASIALELGLKPMLRELIAVPELDAARARFERDGFAVEISPMVVGATYDGWLGRPASREGAARDAGADRRPVYVGRDRARLREAIEAELSRTLEGARALGALLGYPACCVEAFVSAGRDRRAHRLWAGAAARTEGRFEARLDVLDHAVFSYVSWFPCRFDCAPSLALADALAEALEARHPELVRAIDRALGAPRLVLAPEVQLVLAGSLGAEGITIASMRAAACDRDPRAHADAREADVTARALAWLADARTLSVRDATLVVDGAARTLPLEAPLPLLLPFVPRA